MEKISVIIPVYNVEQYFERCIQSIVNQTYKNLEIILVNDGSTDKSGMLCDKWTKIDDRIKVIHKENQGQGLARNRGLEEATGKYVTFIDSDDWIGLNHIRDLYYEIKQNDADLCIGGCTRVSKEGREQKFRIRLEQKTYNKEEIIDKLLLPLIAPDVNYLAELQVDSSSSMSLYSLDLIKENKLKYPSEREAVAEDFFFNIDYLYYSSKVVTADITSYFYFENVNSTSRKFRKERFERTIKYYYVLKEKIKTYSLENVVGYRVERSYIVKLRVAIKHVVLSDLRFVEKINFINKMLKHEVTEQVLKTYPIQTYSKGLMIIAFLMRYKMAFFVYLAMKVRMKFDR